MKQSQVRQGKLTRPRQARHQTRSETVTSCFKRSEFGSRCVRDAIRPQRAPCQQSVQQNRQRQIPERKTDPRSSTQGRNVIGTTAAWSWTNTKQFLGRLYAGLHEEDQVQDDFSMQSEDEKFDEETDALIPNARDDLQSLT